MRAPRISEVSNEGTVHERRPKDRWNDGSRVHIVSGVSVLEAKRIVRTLDDAAFDPERAQLVRVPVRAKLPRAPPPKPKPKPRADSERTLMFLFLLLVLGLQLLQLTR